MKNSYLPSSKNKRYLFIAVTILAIAGLGWLFFFNKKQAEIPSVAYAKYIDAYTSGLISKKSSIRIHFAQALEGFQELNKADERKLFKFSPSLAGKAYWIDAQTIEFRPDEDLKPNQLYEASFQLDKVLPTEKGLEKFIWGFQVLSPAIQVENTGLVTQNNTDLRYMKLQGSVKTADVEKVEQIEQLLQIEKPSNLKIKWEHQNAQQISYFRIDSIQKTQSETELHVSWNGKAIDAKQKGELNLKIPALGVFKVLQIKAIQKDQDYALIQFSEPLHPAQDLTGLVQLSKITEPRFTIEGSELKVYANESLQGDYQIRLFRDIQNIESKKLNAELTANLKFEDTAPSVSITGQGSILPSSGKLVLPFEAVNLKAVDVTIIKIYENNIPQFFQNNQYQEGNDLRRVAKPILQKTIALDTDKSIDLHKKNRFTLDLDDLIKREPGAMYRVTLAFRRAYSAQNCSDATVAETENEDTEDLWGEKIDEDDDFWMRYNNYYPHNYRWDERDNPCSDSYYTAERWVSRNLIASNIGLIAKRGNDNSMLIVATDLRTAQPIAGAAMKLLDFQQQVIFQGETNSDGSLGIEAMRKPFLLVAAYKKEKSYLKLDDALTLPLSRFDVGGDVVQQGLKGFIYGERGVWRPGDQLHLTFMLDDQNKKLPAHYPVTLEILNPKGQLYKRLVNAKPLNGVYAFQLSTEATAPTGNWLARVKVGGATFNKTLKIETILPNRLKINLSAGALQVLRPSTEALNLSAKWLFGADAKHLKAKVDVNFSPMETRFKGFESYSFDNPIAAFDSQLKNLFDGTLNEQGQARIPLKNQTNLHAPGQLRANFSTKVFEPGGGFSIDYWSVPYHVYNNYYGLKSPEGAPYSGMLYTDKDHKIDIVNVNDQGQLLAGTKSVQLELYKVEWRWWWEQEDAYSKANFSQNASNKLVAKEIIQLKNGKAAWNLRRSESEWGRYLILIRDLNGGHISGKYVYVDWPGWQQRELKNNPTEASMLSFTADKDKYKVGENIHLNIPSGKDGRALISIENGTKVLKTYWVDTKAGQTQYQIKALPDMAPNIYINITLLQPHAQTSNDLPIRLYGAIPLSIENPATVLKPLIRMAEKLKPESNNNITISEAQGKAMTYTIALVDEGLLDLTRFKTPDPHAVFYAREGLGVKTWDLYDQVLGAWGNTLERLLSIGGDGQINRNLNPAKANRFKPVVTYLGPFFLDKGQSKTHSFKLPPYVGSIRAMVVAKQDAAYGQSEKSAEVKKPLMLLATLPRVIGPGESFTLPVSVFATESHLKNVQVSVKSGFLTLLNAKVQPLSFAAPGEQMAYFQLQAPNKIGMAKLQVLAQSGKEQALYEVDIEVRNPNPYLSKGVSKVLQAGEKWSTNVTGFGSLGSRKGYVELSALPGINFSKHLNFLIQYPHGCVEQITSGAFPQLFLGQFTALSDQQKGQSERNIKSVINRLKSYQTVDGGLSYWPGQSEADDWGSSYALHFLVEAQNAGYTMPVDLLNNLIKYQQNKAQAWAPNTQQTYAGDLNQAYRLYGLALAKKANLAAMNRLKAFEYLSVPAKWRLAAAYKLAGQAQAATGLINGLAIEAPATQNWLNTFGSALRDEAMVLETLSLLEQKNKAKALVEKVAKQLDASQIYSTQTTAYALLALAKYSGQNKNGINLKANVLIDGKQQQVQQQNYLSRLALGFKSPQLQIQNTGSQVIFVNLQLEGQPLVGEDHFIDNDPTRLSMQVMYKQLDGKILDPKSLKQGTDFYAEVQIKNPGSYGPYMHMALTQIFPSGWEIINTRLNNNEGALSSSAYTYRDIRDDRVFTYFNLPEHQTLVYKVLLNASYLGKFYMPAIYAEAMYDPKVKYTQEGYWVEVKK